ncbi:cupin domain-containing protein [Haloglycomyces albus]|uniref:cupin domain-containing protein n=1 Tax=Haloglycomyces albus TaxID=526067 RepID=UPI0012EB60FF
MGVDDEGVSFVAHMVSFVQRVRVKYTPNPADRRCFTIGFRYSIVYGLVMDPLSDFLRGIRSDGAMVCRASLQPPWVVDLNNSASLRMITILRGRAVLKLPDGSSTEVQEHHTALVNGVEAVRVADAEDSFGYPYHCDSHSSWNDSREDTDEFIAENPNSAVLVAGSYQALSRRHEPLLQALPTVTTYLECEEALPVMNYVADKAASKQAGTQAMVDRFLDWGLVCSLQEWFSRQGDQAPRWYRGMSDDIVGPALEVIHDDVGHRWTVESLARHCRVSRAAFAERFREVMDEPPLRYLTRLRMHRAQELLAESDLSIAAIARTVGYANTYGFSNAFKNTHHVRPTEFRLTSTA